MILTEDRILYEDNHLIAVNKRVSELSQGDKTDDRSLIDDVKDFLKKKYLKPGNVYLGLPHRLDRPTSGAILFAKTEKALVRLNDEFRKDGEVRKFYWAIVDLAPGSPKGTLVHWIVRDSATNKSTAYNREVKDSKKAVMNYRIVASSERYHLLEIELVTGRHHQIRAQLRAIGVHIKGDLKYGASRSNPDGGICLHSRKLILMHPVKKTELEIVAPVPDDNLWRALEEDRKRREF